MECNICGSVEFEDFNGRTKAVCTNCRSMERTRALFHLVNDLDVLKPGAKVLHFAPEMSLARLFIERVGDENYHRHDFSPELFPPELGVTRFDLVTDVWGLPDDTYDLIIHSHVLEHVPCWLAAVFWNLQRALKPDGRHVFALPFLDVGGSSENLDPSIGDDARQIAFGQRDHVRAFSLHDVDATLGTLFTLNDTNSRFILDEDFARKHNIARGEVAKTFFALRKSDWRLRVSAAC